MKVLLLGNFLRAYYNICTEVLEVRFTHAAKMLYIEGHRKYAGIWKLFVSFSLDSPDLVVPSLYKSPIETHNYLTSGYCNRLVIWFALCMAITVGLSLVSFTLEFV